jgi:perosamine synthetase
MIPVFEPDIREEDLAAVQEALRRGEISGSFGQSIPAFERAFADYCGVKHGVALTSGTTALHLACAAAGVGPGDEVLVSASTNIATALGAYHLGAVPVPIDSEPVTWNLDLDQVAGAVGPKTRAIIPVHLFGHPVDMDRLMALADRHGLTVIEDAAEAHGALCRGRKVGSFGHMACFSFYANKHITTGEGGMVMTNDDALADRLRLLRNLAFATPRFRHELAGYNFRMTGYQAAMGVAQLGRLDSIIEAKRRLADTYRRHLADIPGLQLPVELDWAFHVYWMYAVVVRPEFGPTRDELAASLKWKGIDTRTFFCPMNLQPCFGHFERCRSRACPVAEEVWRSGLYLPSSTSLTEGQVAEIAGAIRGVAAA